jgi:hypothetical protein
VFAHTPFIIRIATHYSELNNLAWGFARLGHRSERAERLFMGVANELTMRTWQFKPQDIGTTLWSLATSGCFDYGAFRAGASRYAGAVNRG